MQQALIATNTCDKERVKSKRLNPKRLSCLYVSLYVVACHGEKYFQAHIREVILPVIENIFEHNPYGQNKS
jgi:hypothetical protein